MAVNLNTSILKPRSAAGPFTDNWLCKRVIKDLRCHETRTEEGIDSLRNGFLHRTWFRPYRKLPYYSRIPKSFSGRASVEVLQQHFPIISKETLLEKPGQLYRTPESPGRELRRKTAARREPLFPYQKSEIGADRKNAFLRRHWEWGDTGTAPRRATLRGRNDRAFDRAAPPFWFWNRLRTTSS